MKASKQYNLNSRMADLRYDAEKSLFKILKKLPDKTFSFKNTSGEIIITLDENNHLPQIVKNINLENLINITLNAEDYACDLKIAL